MMMMTMMSIQLFFNTWLMANTFIFPSVAEFDGYKRWIASAIQTAMKMASTLLLLVGLLGVLLSTGNSF